VTYKLLDALCLIFKMMKIKSSLACLSKRKISVYTLFACTIQRNMVRQTDRQAALAITYMKTQ